jgi:hypothetical protein
MKKELKDYIDSKQNTLKRVMVKNTNVLLVRFDSLKWVVGESSEMIGINKEVLQNNLYISNLDELYKLEDLNSFDILSRDRIDSYITMNISAHICLDNFLKQYQTPIVEYCMGIKDSINSDADRLKIEKVELTSLYSIIQIPDTLLARLSKVEKDIDDELEVGVAKLKECITILDKFNKMVDEVIASKEAWCGLLDIMNKK